MLCLVGVLCVRTSCLQAEEEQIDLCISYMDEVIAIHNQRQILRLGYEYMLQKYEAEERPQKELDSLSRAWYTLDDELAQKTAKVYDRVYAENCIAEDTNESSRTQSRDAP